MKKTKKMSKRKCSTTKKGLKYFISCTPCMINTLVFIALCVGGTMLYKHIRANHVFKIDQKLELLSEPFLHVPNFNDDKSKISFHWFDAFNADISNMDLSLLGDKINFISFDNLTKFPSDTKMPKGFEPKKLLEAGKNPGLGVRGLHAKGITGKGITVAVIDWPLYPNHQEIKDNFVHYEEPDWDRKKMDYEFHGVAMASVLCGKAVGVAPDAKLAYFAPSIIQGIQDEKAVEGHLYISGEIAVLQKILKMNKKLPKDKRISAVSISRGWYNKSNLFPEFKKVVKDLIDSGVFVLYVGADEYEIPGGFGCSITGRMPNSDPDDVNSYFVPYGCNGTFVAPSGGRTVAGNQSTDNYRYTGIKQGGASETVPYVVGTWALAKQVYPDLMPKEFFKIAYETGYRLESVNGNYNILIQPTKIIEYLQNKNVK